MTQWKYWGQPLISLHLRTWLDGFIDQHTDKKPHTINTANYNSTKAANDYFIID